MLAEKKKQLEKTLSIKAVSKKKQNKIKQIIDEL